MASIFGYYLSMYENKKVHVKSVQQSKTIKQALLQNIAQVPKYPIKYKSLWSIFHPLFPIHINLAKQFQLVCWPARVSIISKALMEEQYEKEKEAEEKK